MIDNNEKLRAALTLAADFTATAQAVNDAHAEQRAVLQAVRERIAADKRRAEERRMELQGTVTDGSRSVTVRSLAQHELDALSAVSYGPTAEERAAFDAATRAGTQAVADLRTARTALRDTLADARAELEHIRSKTTGEVDVDLMQRWLDGCQAEFDRL
jgi:hypothetical protein